MNLRALRVFLGVMDDGTLTRAADRLNLSQSAASRLLSLLEEALGAPLFLREKRQMTPTAAAEALYPEALRILAQVGALPEVVSSAQSRTAMQVICHSRLAGGLVVPAIASVARDHPDLPIRLETAPRRELARRVLTGRYDFAIAALPLSLGTVTATPLGRLRLQVVLPKTHKLARAPHLDLADLSGERYIALDETTAVRRAIDATMDTEGQALLPSLEVSTGTNAYRLVAAGLGFTFGDAIALDPELKSQLALVPFRKEISLEIGYFNMAREVAPATSAFEQALNDFAKAAMRL